LFNDLNLAMCRPDGWFRVNGDDELTRGLCGGYASADVASAPELVFLFSYYSPKEKPDIVATKFLQRTQDSLRNMGVMQGQFSTPSNICAEFPEKSVTRALYRDPRMIVLAKAWVTQKGMAHVGAVVRRIDKNSPTSVEPDDQDCGLLASMTNID
jgi:hypothetical protein